MKNLCIAICVAAGAAAPLLAQPDLEEGLTFRLYSIGRPMERLAPLAPEERPNRDRRIDAIDFGNNGSFEGPEDFFVVEVSGYVVIERAGEHEFRLISDDGSLLEIGGSTVIVHDGVHPDTAADGSVELEAGLHPIRVQMFENQGGAVLRLLWKPPGDVDFSLVPSSAFRIERGARRITSPGRKTVLDGRENLRPGHGMALDGVHPSWEVEDLRPDGFEPQVGGMAFLPDGRLVLSSFKPLNDGKLHDQPRGTIWMLDNVIDGSTDSITATQIADGFHDPTGIAVVDGDIYIASKYAITRMRDSDGDGQFETREIFCDDFVTDNYHHFTFGLIPHEGYLYGTLSTSIYFGNTIKNDNVQGQVVALNGPNPYGRGTCFRVSLETAEIEYLAGGFRTPNGIGVGPRGEMFVSDNQGAFLPASKLINVREGRFYGHENGRQVSDRYPDGGFPALHEEAGESPPAVWLPQNECSNSPTMPLLIEEGPFAEQDETSRQMYLAELTMGGIRRVFLEEVGGEWQGCAFRFTQGFEAGVNRLVRGPDGCLYAGCTGSSGNWSWRGKMFGLQRLRPTGETAFEYHSVRAEPDGFTVRFTRPIESEWLETPANYLVTQWRYERTPQYGGPKRDVERLAVGRATPTADGMGVRLVIPGLKPGNVVHLMADPRSTSGEQIWSTEAWYTLNRIPAE